MNAANSSADLKSITPTMLYNMTQDNLHLVILDFRALPKYLGAFIRRSYPLDAKEESLEVIHDLYTYVEKIASNSEEYAKKYNTPKTKRLVAIVESENATQNEIVEFLNRSNLLDQFDRKYALLDAFDSFRQKYPFLVLSLPESSCAFSPEDRHKYLMTNHANELVYANSQFPLEIVENKIFLGSNFNKNSQKQRNDLSIGYAVEIKKSTDAHNTVLADEQKRDLVVNFDLEKMIDFDSMIDEVNGKSSEQPILVCGTSLDLSAGFLIALLMKNLKLEINAASLRVFSKIGNTTVDRTLYNHLIHYTPNKIHFKKI
jgi:hypothetical protein